MAVLSAGHAALSAVAAAPDVPVTVTVAAAVPVPAVVVAVAVARSSVPMSVDTTAVLLSQQFAVSPAGRQQYVPRSHWSTFQEATSEPPPQSVVAV